MAPWLRLTGRWGFLPTWLPITCRAKGHSSTPCLPRRPTCLAAVHNNNDTCVCVCICFVSVFFSVYLPKCLLSLFYSFLFLPHFLQDAGRSGQSQPKVRCVACSYGCLMMSWHGCVRRLFPGEFPLPSSSAIISSRPSSSSSLSIIIARVSVSSLRRPHEQPCILRHSSQTHSTHPARPICPCNYTKSK